MTTLPIYAPDGSQKLLAPVTVEAVLKSRAMEECCVSLSFKHNEFLSIPVGSYLLYGGRKWELLNEYIPESIANAYGYKYDVTFYAQQHHMKRRRMFWTQDNISEAAFSLTTTLRTFAELICENMNTFLGVDYWSIGNIPETMSEKTISLSFDGTSCWDGVVQIAEGFETEWWVDDKTSPSSVVLNFGKIEFGEYEDFSEGDVISKLPIAKAGEDTDYGTRFYVYGGSRNIPEGYRHTDQGGTTNHVSERRLRLPIGTDYVDAWDNLLPQEVVEQVVFIDDIFPKNEETITSVTTRTMVSSSTKTTVYRIYCANTAFTPSHLLDTLGATFTTGSLQGREFELKMLGESDSTFTKGFEIIVQRENAGGDSEVYVPNEYLHPQVGDKFILTGVKLPNESTSQAEFALLRKAQDIAHQRSKDTNNYDCPTNAVYCHTHDKDYDIGQKVRLVGQVFGPNGRESRIVGYEKKLYDRYQATYTVGENIRKSKLSVIETNIKVNRENNKTENQGTLIKIDRQDFGVRIVYDGLESLRTDTVNAEAELRASIQSVDSKASNAEKGAANAMNEVSAQKTQVEANGTALTKLIADDKNMSIREVAADVVLTSMPTEVATAKQKLVISTPPVGGIYQANIVYEWVSSPTEVNINGLHAANEQYDNEWTIRFGCTSDTEITISPTVLWKDGIQPAFGSWGICEMRFRSVSMSDAYIGEWNVFKY